MKRFNVVFLLALAGPAFAQAQAPAPSGASQPSGARDIKFTNRSSFQTDGGPGRNPFLPIGYVRAVAPVAKEVVPEVKAEMFTLSGTMGSEAIINGKIYDLNARVPVPAVGGEVVVLRRIGDGNVVLDHRGRLITVQLGRKK